MSFEFLDDLIREYLLFRGFHVTLKTFDQEIKSDKLTNFDANKLAWTLLQLAQSLDFLSIEETWNYLQTYVFTSFLSENQLQQAKQLEISLYKYFIVCGIFSLI
ncbi:WD repeat-containing protein 91 [Coelomomyces lativittatus]|nr:WD repeat-containing protein 91 [Coelomomyces lativittatus]